VIDYKWYRYDYSPVWDNELSIVLREFYVVKQTRRGVWLCELFSKELPSQSVWKGIETFVLRDARKRFAYPDVKLAKESFRIRKKREVQHCVFQAKKAKLALKLLDKGEEKGYLGAIDVEFNFSGRGKI
jgi:hypothetical protein